MFNITTESPPAGIEKCILCNMVKKGRIVAIEYVSIKCQSGRDNPQTIVQFSYESCVNIYICAQASGKPLMISKQLREREHHKCVQIKGNHNQFGLLMGVCGCSRYNAGLTSILCAVSLRTCRRASGFHVTNFKHSLLHTYYVYKFNLAF